MIELTSKKFLTPKDHLTDDCVMEGEWLAHYSKFKYDVSPRQDKSYALPCVSWMNVTRHYNPVDVETGRHMLSGEYEHIAPLGNFGYSPYEGFFHRCENVWGGSILGAWVQLDLYKHVERNLDLWTISASGNDNLSMSFDILDETAAIGYFDMLKTLPYNTITPEWCGCSGWYNNG